MQCLEGNTHTHTRTDCMAYHVIPVIYRYIFLTALIAYLFECARARVCVVCDKCERTHWVLRARVLHKQPELIHTHMQGSRFYIRIA